MKYLLFFTAILVIACCPAQKKKEKSKAEVPKVEILSPDECSHIVNETRVDFTLFAAEHNLDDVFQVFASDMVLYIERHVLFELRSNEIVNRDITLNEMKKHLSYIDEIMAPYVSKKDRKEIYAYMGKKLVSLVKYKKPADDDEPFDTLVVQGLGCYTFGVRVFFKRYDGMTIDEENKNKYMQESLDYINMDELFGVKSENNDDSEDENRDNQKNSNSVTKNSSSGNSKNKADNTDNKALKKISDTSKDKFEGAQNKVGSRVEGEVDKKIDETISSSLDSVLGGD